MLHFTAETNMFKASGDVFSKISKQDIIPNEKKSITIKRVIRRYIYDFIDDDDHHDDIHSHHNLFGTTDGHNNEYYINKVLKACWSNDSHILAVAFNTEYKKEQKLMFFSLHDDPTEDIDTILKPVSHQVSIHKDNNQDNYDDINKNKVYSHYESHLWWINQIVWIQNGHGLSLMTALITNDGNLYIIPKLGSTFYQCTCKSAISSMRSLKSTKSLSLNIPNNKYNSIKEANFSISSHPIKSTFLICDGYNIAEYHIELITEEYDGLHLPMLINSKILKCKKNKIFPYHELLEAWKILMAYPRHSKSITIEKCLHYIINNIIQSFNNNHEQHNKIYANSILKIIKEFILAIEWNKHYDTCNTILKTLISNISSLFIKNLYFIEAKSLLLAGEYEINHYIWELAQKYQVHHNIDEQCLSSFPYIWAELITSSKKHNQAIQLPLYLYIPSNILLTTTTTTTDG